MTQAITTIIAKQRAADIDSEMLVTIYTHQNGEPQKHGAALHKVLSNIRLVYGLNPREVRHVANGAQCLAAQLVHVFKQQPHSALAMPVPGGTYLVAPRTTLDGVQYGYEVTVHNIECTLNIVVRDENGQRYNGGLFQFGNFCQPEI